MVRYALLGLLRERPDYGYHLKRRFDERVGALWHLNIGQVYQTLRSFERTGMVTAQGNDDADHPGRRLYELTTKGLRALERWSRRPPTRPRPVRDETLIRLLLLEPERRAELLERLADQEQVYQRHLARLVDQKRRASPFGHAMPVRQIGIEAAVLHTEAHLKWLAVCRERVRATAVPAEGVERRRR
jgi:PadR family transcriptional regulator AphA